MKIVVTGVTGFIGKNFMESVKNDQNQYLCLVRGTSNTAYLKDYPNVSVQKSSFHYDELCSFCRQADVVIHMAGQMGGYGIPFEAYDRVNCRMTSDITKACIENGVRQLIYLSTPGVQGFGKRLCEEKEAYAPRNMYEETKVKAEKIIINAAADSDLKYTILRPDFVYGPGDYRRIKMYKTIKEKKFVLTTSGKAYIHPTYVQDVVQGILLAVSNSNAYNEIFNLSADKDISVQEYLEIIAAYFQVKVIKINIGYTLSVIMAAMIDKFYRVFLHKEGFVSKNKIDFLAIDHSTSNKKAKRMLHFQPQYSFQEGFCKTMEWCEKEYLLSKGNGNEEK